MAVIVVPVHQVGQADGTMATAAMADTLDPLADQAVAEVAGAARQYLSMAP